MNIYLKNERNEWEYYENVSVEELDKRNIKIGSGARIGSGASIGQKAELNGKTDCIVLGPIGSRNSMLTGYLQEGKLMLGTGCFIDEEKEFLEKLEKTHGDNEHAKRYKSAIKFFKENLRI